MGEKDEVIMQTMKNEIRISTLRSAKAAGLMDVLLLRRKHVAVLFKPAAGIPAQAEPAILTLFGRSPAWDGRTAPANASGFLRSALSAEVKSSGFLSLTRYLTKQRQTE